MLRGAVTGNRDPIDIGSEDTGGFIIKPDGYPVGVLSRKGMPLFKDNGQYLKMPGATFVQVSLKDWVDNDNPAPGALVNYRQRIVGDFSWGTGGNGGQARVDLQHGTIVSILGTHAVNLDVKILETDWPGAAAAYDADLPPSIPGYSLRCEAVIHWSASGNPKDTYCTLPRVSLTPTEEAGVSPYIPIPQQSESVLVNTTQYPSSNLVYAEFYWSDIAAGPTVAYRVTDPIRNGCILAHNVKFMRLFNSVGAPTAVFTPIFRLNI